jgi:hypothetical protein
MVWGIKRILPAAGVDWVYVDAARNIYVGLVVIG